ncbi:MAG: biopolymer transporter ExbD, partial [Winogradskyella sp.]|nr:biopolymer transporter ExbD [Winogradskyella sp.]
PIDDSEIEPPIIKQKNLFTVLLNRHDQLLVEEEEMDVKNLRQAAIDFLDNGGGENAEGQSCTYCRGKKDPASSDHPDKAIISVTNDRETSYGKYIEVQNELVAAYNFLRDREARRLYNRSFQSMLDEKAKNQFKKDEKLNAQIETIKKMYPLKLSEAEPKN